MINWPEPLRQGWTTRRVWWFTATARTRARFARTALGSFWLGLSNLLSIMALAAVYGTVFRVDDFRSYVVYLGMGLVCWNAIASAALAAPNLFSKHASSLANTNIHPIFYTLEDWAFQLQTFCQSFVLVAVVLSIAQPNLILNLLIHGWLPLINLLLLVYWLPLLICILGARFYDLYQLIPIAVQLMFLLSPILYKKDNLGGLIWTANWNPLYQIIAQLRNAAIQGDPHYHQSVMLLGINGLGLTIALALLERERRHLPFLV